MNYAFKMILFVLCFLFIQPLNLSYANWNNINKDTSETNNLSSNQVEEISLILPKPPNFKDKVINNRDEIINYDKLNNFQKWNWIFEYSRYCSHNKFIEVIKYINSNNENNQLIKLMLNTNKMIGITKQDIDGSDQTNRVTYSHFISSCNSEMLDVYLVELNNLINFFESDASKIKLQTINYTLSKSIPAPIQSKYITLKENKSDFYNWGVILSYLDECNRGKFGWHNKIWKIEMFLKKNRGNNYVKEIKSGRIRTRFIDDKNATFFGNNRVGLYIKTNCNSNQVETYYKELITLIDNIKTLTTSKPKINQKLKTISNSNKKTKEAEDKCTEIGFKKGTEKYGDCVLKMLELI